MPEGIFFEFSPGRGRAPWPVSPESLGKERTLACCGESWLLRVLFPLRKELKGPDDVSSYIKGRYFRSYAWSKNVESPTTAVVPPDTNRVRSRPLRARLLPPLVTFFVEADPLRFCIPSSWWRDVHEALFIL